MHTCVRARTNMQKRTRGDCSSVSGCLVCCHCDCRHGDPVKAGIRGSESLLGPSERPFFSSYKLTLVQTCVVVDHFSLSPSIIATELQKRTGFMMV